MNYLFTNASIKRSIRSRPCFYAIFHSLKRHRDRDRSYYSARCTSHFRVWSCRSDNTFPLLRSLRHARTFRNMVRRLSSKADYLDDYPEIKVKKKKSEYLDAYPEPSKKKMDIDEEEVAPSGNLFVRRLNYLLEHHSSTFAYCYFGQRSFFFIFIAYLVNDMLLLSGAEFVLAWLFTRFTAKFRVPTNLFLALGLRKIFPVLEEIHFSNILIYKPNVARLGREDLSILEKRRLKRQKGKLAQNDDETPYPEDQLKGFTVKEQIMRGMEVKWQRNMETWNLHEGKISKEERKWRRSVFEAEKQKYFRRAVWAEWLRDQVAGPVDRMGMSWYITAKCTSFFSVVGVLAAVHYGLDVQGYLVHNLGFREEVDNFSGAMAASLLFNTFLVPPHFILAKVFTQMWTGDDLPGDNEQTDMIRRSSGDL